MGAVSIAQQRVINDIRAGCSLIKSFDVYGGDWWWLRPIAKKIPAATAEAMERHGLIVAGERRRIYSGYHETEYSLATPASVARPLRER